MYEKNIFDEDFKNTKNAKTSLHSLFIFGIQIDFPIVTLNYQV